MPIKVQELELATESLCAHGRSLSDGKWCRADDHAAKTGRAAICLEE